MSLKQRISLSITFAFFCLLFISTAAFADTVLTDDNGISDFTLYNNGVYWWSAGGKCTPPEFAHAASIGLRGTFASANKSLASSCSMLEDSGDNTVRDSAYFYFFSAGQLQRKAVNALESDPAQPLALAPALPANQGAAYLVIAEGQLYWPRYDAGTAKSNIQRMPADGSSAPQTLTNIGGKVAKMAWQRYTDSNSNTVDALVVLAQDGKLYRYKLNQAGAPVQLATGVADFALHTTFGLVSSSTVIYAARAASSVDQNTPAGSLLNINLDSGAMTVVYTPAGHNQLTSVATDSDSGIFGPTKNIYIAEAPIVCDLLCNIGDPVIKRHPLPGNNTNWQTIVATGVSGSLHSDDTWLYYISAGHNTIEKISTDAPALQFDVQADAVEVVQTIQSLNMDVQLVANKPTYARGYVHLAQNTTGKAVWWPRVVLHGFLNGQELSGSPIEPLFDRGVDNTSDLKVLRGDVNRSFLFKLPDSWVKNAGALNVQLVVDPNNTLPETGSKANNKVSLKQAASLTKKADTCIDTVSMKTANTIESQPDKMPEMVARTRSLLPVPNLQVFPSNVLIAKPVFHVDVECWLIFCAPVPYFTDEAYNMSADKNTAMAWLTIWDTLNPDFNSCDDSHLVGMVDPSEPTFNGLGLTSFSNDVLVRMDPTANGAPVFNSPYGGRTLAHELSHNYGREHIDETTSPLKCPGGAPKGPFDSYPLDPCTIGNPSDANTWYGFDTISRSVITPTMAGDLMSYANTRWTSQFTWNADFQKTGGLVQAANVNAPAVTGPQLFVSGLITPTQNTGRFETFYLFPDGVAPAAKVAQSNNAAQAAAVTATYAIRQVDANGTTLLDTAVVLPAASDDGGDAVGFAQFVPFQAQTKRIQLVQGSTVLAEKAVSAHAPTLTLDAPVVDESNHTLALHWSSGDPDNTLKGGFTDMLAFTVQYSPDNGTTWRNVLLQYPWLAATINTDLLAGSTQARIRVFATDGVNTTIATSEPFTLAKHAPAPQIGGVNEGQRLNYGAVVTLLGLAYDAEDGILADDKLNWTISGPSSQNGTGSQLVLTDLAPGSYTVNLSVTDSDNQTGTATGHFEVLPLVVANATAPSIDGFCNDTGYAGAALVHIPLGNGQTARGWLLHANSKLIACFTDLTLASSGAPSMTVGLRVDANASGEAQAQTGDIGFIVDENGIPYQLVANGGQLTPTLSPQAGYAAAVQRSANGWSAELEIAESLVGGWDHAARVMFSHGALSGNQVGVWPAGAAGSQPASWAAAYFGTLPQPANRAPVADAGADVYENVAVTKTVTLDGRSSADPDGDALTHSWMQVGGPTVNLQNANTATPSFTATPVGAATQLRFQLVVNDGKLNSVADEVVVNLLPTLMPHTPATFTPADFTPSTAAKIYLPLVTR